LRAAAPDIRIVAFLSHVQRELAEQAKNGGLRRGDAAIELHAKSSWDIESGENINEILSSVFFVARSAVLKVTAMVASLLLGLTVFADQLKAQESSSSQAIRLQAPLRQQQRISLPQYPQPPCR